MKYRDIRLTFFNLAQAMTNQAQAVATQTQAMTALANREVGPHVNQNFSTIGFSLEVLQKDEPSNVLWVYGE